jgi:hypothetical protein
MSLKSADDAAGQDGCAIQLRGLRVSVTPRTARHGRLKVPLDCGLDVEGGEVKPYYEDSSVSLYLGDALEVCA